MDCPFCGEAMEHGCLVAATSTLRWESEEIQRTKRDRFFGNFPYGQLMNTSWGIGARIQGDYCPRCRKMIFETGIEN